MQVIPYLNFAGQAEAALNFYAAAGLGKVTNLSRFKDMPPGSHPNPPPPEQIMHGRVTGDAGDVLMVSDGGAGATPQGMSLSIAIQDLSQAQALFDALGQDGHIDMPMARTFWGADFGMLTDKFGIKWMVNCETPA